ncbi:phosphoenolpyruvate phosphomutase-domain-containing protein [Mycena olivaceomarginata]|nr:phosphoenolpyruvate phosphomutase-domain-containing protein [Mycena olivaceomarginata]
MDRAEQNTLAQQFAAMHNPKDLLMLCNAFDGGSARAIASNPRAKAIASASYAAAIVSGSADDDLTLDDNLAAKPVTIDLQDGYGDQLARAIEEIIKLGAVGATSRTSTVARTRCGASTSPPRESHWPRRVAARCGVPDFVVNARCDALFQGADAGMDSVIRRGKAYLAAGATTVSFGAVGGGRGVSSSEIKRLVDEFGGMLNVSMIQGEGFLKKDQIQALGLARVSMGPGLYIKALKAFSSEVDAILEV